MKAQKDVSAEVSAMESKKSVKENRVLDWDDEIEDLSQEECEARYGKASYPDEESDWNAWKEEELMRDKIEEERGKNNDK